jgi:hypothetical protein
MSISRHAPVVLPALGLVAALAWPREASAQNSHHAVSPGLSLGVSFGERTSFSIGLDVRYSYLPQGDRCGDPGYGFGPFGQAALLIGRGGVAWRFAAGAHAGSSVLEGGVQPAGELGWTYHTSYGATPSRPEIPGWHGLHIGLVTWFLLAEELSVRGAIPLGGPSGAFPEVTIAAGARFPPPYGMGVFCVSGRPLRSGDEALLPPVLFAEGGAPLSGALDSVTRSALAEAWLDDARNECASIPVFLALARDLAAVGAPEALVTRALLAAEDEARHTLLCSAMASRLSGTLAMPLLLPTPPPADASREDALLRLAIESWRDGCLGEGVAAERARRALPHTRDPLARAALTRIAVDEQGHADLAGDVLRFCLAEGGRAVVEAVAAEMAATEAALPESALPGQASFDEQAWSAHGRLDAVAIRAAWQAESAAARRIGGRSLVQLCA